MVRPQLGGHSSVGDQEMSHTLALLCITLARVFGATVRLRTDQRGTVAVMMALLLPVLVGGLGLGLESSNWYLKKRAMQNDLTGLF